MILRPVACFAGKVPKQGNRTEECEDEFEASPETGHFAVADGATEASYAQEWARILVKAFPQIDGTHLDPDRFATWLMHAGKSGRGGRPRSMSSPCHGSLRKNSRWDPLPLSSGFASTSRQLQRIR